MDRQDAQMIAEAIAETLKKGGGKSFLGSEDFKDVEKLNSYIKNLNKTIDSSRTTMGSLTKELVTGKKRYVDLESTLASLDEQLETMKDNLDETNEAQFQELTAKRKEIAAIQRNSTMIHTSAQMVGIAGKTLAGIATTIARGAQTVAKDIINNTDIFTTIADTMDVQLDVQNQTVQGFASAGKAAAGGLMTLGPMGMAAGAGLYIASEALSFFSQALTEAQKFYNRFVLSEGTKLIQGFQRASSAGAMFSNGMQGMADAAGKSGLTIKQFSDAVARNADTLAKSGMGVGEGADAMARAMKAGGAAAKTQLLNLGYTFEEQADLYAETMADMRRANDPRIKDEVAVHQATMQYAENLRTIAAITGEDAKKKMEESRQLAAQAAFRLKLQELEKRQPGITQQVMQSMETMSPVMKQAVMQQIGLGVVVDKNANILMANSEGFANGVKGTVAQIESGRFNLEENQRLQGKSNDQFRDNLGNFKAISMAALAGVNGVAGEFDKTLTGQLLQSDKVTAKSVEEAQLRTKQQKDTQDQLTRTVVDAVQAGQDMAKELEQLAITELPHFRDAIQDTIKFIRENIGTAKKAADIAANPMSHLGQDVGKVGFGITVLGGIVAGLGALASATGIGAAAGIPMMSAGASMVSGGASAFGAGALMDAVGFAGGGIAMGPNSGHLELLHGTEAVIPLPDGKSIPVEMSGVMDGSNTELMRKIDQLMDSMSKSTMMKAAGSTDSMSSLMDKMQTLMNAQLDVQKDMVSHVSDSKDLMRKLVNVSM